MIALQHLFKIEIFCDIINVFNVSLDQFNASLLNKSTIFLKKKFLLSPLLNSHDMT